MDIPEDIQALARLFEQKRIEEEQAEKARKAKVRRQWAQLQSDRLKVNLENAKVVFDWANGLYDSITGKILMAESHPPTAYKNIFFFDGRVAGKEWCGFLLEDGKGLCLSDGGRWAAALRTEVKNVKHLAGSVDPEILSEVVKWIDDGRAWDCIKRRFKRERTL